MASEQGFVEYLCEQMRDAGKVSWRKMFGDYAIYCDGKVVALVSDNQLFVKPTTSGKAMMTRPVESPPYPGAKPYLRIDEGADDHVWLSKLIAMTAKELPAPKPAKKKN